MLLIQRIGAWLVGTVAIVFSSFVSNAIRGHKSESFFSANQEKSQDQIQRQRLIN